MSLENPLKKILLKNLIFHTDSNRVNKELKYLYFISLITDILQHIFVSLFKKFSSKNLILH